MTAVQHDVTDPDPLCQGDDPCACEQLQDARTQSERLGYLAGLRTALAHVDQGGRAATQIRALLEGEAA